VPGQFLSRSFVVLLRKSIPQNHNLKTAKGRLVVAHGVKKYGEKMYIWNVNDLIEDLKAKKNN
jgi:hypothetical protein